MKKYLVLAMLALSNSHAYSAVIDGIYYSFSGDNATVTSGGSSNSYSGVVVIPEAITYKDKTYSVISIDNYAFNNCTGLTSVTIPNSVTSIGYSTFDVCI